MDDEKSALISLLKKAIRGEPADPDDLPDGIQARMVFRQAELHSVLPLALEPVLLSEELKDWADRNVIESARSR
ncbi:MAG: hypothetical protein J5563_06880, partial [Clostridia bacterium]|nr:hypothetical protein [Clostridia bacterium]